MADFRIGTENIHNMARASFSARSAKQTNNKTLTGVYQREGHRSQMKSSIWPKQEQFEVAVNYNKV